MEPINLLNSYGLTNGLSNFFKANHSVLIERNPYNPSIIRVTIGQTTNTPGIISPTIAVNPKHRYRLSVTGYTTEGTDAFIAVMDSEVHQAVDCPVYLRCENRDIILEFTTEETMDNIKIFIVVAQPKLRQKFYVSNISLQDLGPVIVETCIPPQPLPKTVHEPIKPAPPPKQEEKKPAASGNLSELLNAFHTYNKTNKSLNIRDNSLTPVVLKSHAVELPKQPDVVDDCDCDDWNGPVPCMLNASLGGSFSMNNFNNPFINNCGIGNNNGNNIQKRETNIQLENIDLGVRVVNKQARLLKVYLKHLETLNELITKSYNELVESVERDDKIIRLELKKIITEINFISLASETDVSIFTSHLDTFKMPDLIIDCRGKTIQSDAYNVKIERYELGSRVNEIDRLFTLLFSNVRIDDWKMNHDIAYTIVENLKKNITKYHKTALLQCDTLINRKTVLQ